MCIGADEGCQDVPDPIAPMDIELVSLEPTRMLISLPDITNNGPMFIGPIPCLFSMPGIFPIAPGEGLAPGIGIFIPGIFICGDAAGCALGEGEACGICIPGIFICICRGDDDGEGLACGIFIPGMFIFWGKGLAVGDALVAGIFIPGIFIPGMLPI